MRYILALLLLIPLPAFSAISDLREDSVSTGEVVGTINDNAGLLDAQKLDRRPGDVIPRLQSRYSLGSSTYPWKAVYTDSLVTTYSITGKNRIINGAFAVNQRASSSVADDTYHLDRWYALNQSGNVTIAQGIGQENIQAFNLRMTQPDASPKRIGVAQIVAASNSYGLRSQSVVFSARIRSSVSQAIRIAILEHTGTADSVVSDVVNTWTSTSYTAGNFFLTGATVTAVSAVTPSANTWTAISVTGTTLSTTNNIFVLIWTEGTFAQNTTLDVGLAQLEQGSIPTAYERRLLAEDLIFCQRYYQKSFVQTQPPAQNVGFSAATSITASAAGRFIMCIRFGIIMRGSPTVTTYNPQAANSDFRNSTDSTDTTANLSQTGDSGFLLDGNNAADANDNMHIHWTAVAEL